MAIEPCRRDLDCPVESVCTDGRCESGCRADGDCHPFRICLEGQCGGGCRDNRGCALGEACVGQRCFPGTQPGLCKPCGGQADCDARTDWCLVNRAFVRGDPSSGAPMECAPDCDDAPDLCPSGAICRPVVVQLGACESSADCGSGQACLRDEGEPIGRCTCASNADCSERIPPSCSRFGLCEHPTGRLCARSADCESPETCGPYGPAGAPRCFLDRDRVCDSGADCQCIEGSCVLSGRPCRDSTDCPTRCEGGGCVVGAGCVPEEGLTCPDLR